MQILVRSGYSFGGNFSVNYEKRKAVKSLQSIKVSGYFVSFFNH